MINTYICAVGRTSRMDENMSSKLVSSFTVSCDQVDWAVFFSVLIYVLHASPLD